MVQAKGSIWRNIGIKLKNTKNSLKRVVFGSLVKIRFRKIIFEERELEEKIVSDKINLTFTIDVSQQSIVEKINIFGNNVTRENVIRNQLEIDEGDYYNEILANKTINNLKSLNFFNSSHLKLVFGLVLLIPFHQVRYPINKIQPKLIVTSIFSFLDLSPDNSF